MRYTHLEENTCYSESSPHFLHLSFQYLSYAIAIHGGRLVFDLYSMLSCKKGRQRERKLDKRRRRRKNFRSSFEAYFRRRERPFSQSESRSPNFAILAEPKNLANVRISAAFQPAGDVDEEGWNETQARSTYLQTNGRGRHVLPQP